MSQELTYSEVATHSTKKDLYVVIHDKIYNASHFIDEHPGGEEVLLDVAGSDATEAFEDVGHSDEAREILEGMIVGTLKRVAGDPAPKVAAPSTKTASNAAGTATAGALSGVTLYAVILIAAAVAYGAYVYTQGQEKK